MRQLRLELRYRRYRGALRGVGPALHDRQLARHGGAAEYTGEQHASCTNPLFAERLPTSSSEEFCKLKRGPRDPDSPQKSELTSADWRKILGVDPLGYDFDGIDPHMLESTAPRPGLASPSTPDTADAVHGREWNTQKKDLQYACTYALRTPKECGANPAADVACDCTGASDRTPLCNYADGHPNQQIRGKAYPSIRELAVAKALGKQAIVSSVCPIHEEDNETGTTRCSDIGPPSRSSPSA